MNDQFKYSAFISYNKLDAEWAQWLMGYLENFTLPGDLKLVRPELPEKLSRICRDRDEFAASADIAESVKEKLRQSGALIVVCSPRSANADWVNREINYFTSLGRKENLFCFIIDGDPQAVGQASDCIPSALRLAGFSDRPGLAADARPIGDGPEKAVVKLIAGILHLDFDDLWQRELRRIKYHAYYRAIADTRHNISIDLFGQAAANLYSVAERDKRLDYRHWEWGHLLLGCYLDAYTYTGHTAGVSCLSLSPDLSRIAAGAANGTLKVWELASGTEILSLGAHAKAINSLCWRADGRAILSAGADRTLKLWDVATGGLLQSFPVAPTMPLGQHIPEVFADFVYINQVVATAVFDTTGNRIIATTGASITIWDAGSTDVQAVLPCDELTQAMIVGEENNRLTVISSRCVVLWDLITHKPIRTYRLPEHHLFLGFVDGTGFLTINSENLHLFNLHQDDDLTEEKVIHIGQHNLGDFRGVAYNPQTRLLLVGYGHNAAWRVRYWKLTWRRENEAQKINRISTLH